jgi:outer membrane protein assembly factor BamB
MQPINNGPGQQAPPQNLPTLDTSTPAKGPIVAGENKTLKLGNIEFSYYSVAATYPIYTLGTDILIKARNTGSTVEKFSTTPISELRQAVPNWNRHFFSFQPDNLTLLPGEEKTIHYMASADNPGRFDIAIDFMQDGFAKQTANITIYSGSMEEARLSASAIIFGTAKDESGNPIQNADLKFYTYSGRETYHAQTDGFGRYFTQVPGVDDIQKFFGGQALLNSIEYYAILDVAGYGHFYQDGFAPKRGEKLEANLTVQKAPVQKEYEMKWESNVSDYYGFFYALPDQDWSVIAAAQAKHDPQLGKPTNFYLFNATTGALLWKKATGDECWGFDIRNGLVAAGCSDGHVYVVGVDGKDKWEKDCKSMNREVEFSPDGSLLLTGPCDQDDYVLFDAQTGTAVSTAKDAREALRRSMFSPDGKYFVTGASFGNVAMYFLNGTQVWKNYIGEFPLFLEIDSSGNTYVGGKGRTIFSYDPQGKIRWSFRVPDHVVTQGAISADGSRVAFGTIGAWVYYLDGKTGEVLWKDQTDGENVGHNAVSMTNDGKLVAVGGAPQNKLYIYDEFGTRVFTHVASENPDPILSLKWSGIGRDASAGTQKGVMNTFISKTGNKVVAAYGDDYVREFEMK